MRKKSESFYCFDSYLSVCLKDAVASDILLLKPFMTCPLTSYLMNPGLFYLGRECKCVSLCVVCVYVCAQKPMEVRIGIRSRTGVIDGYDSEPFCRR